MGINLRKIFSNPRSESRWPRKKCLTMFCEGLVLGNPHLGHLKVTCFSVVSTFHRKCLRCLTMLSDALSFRRGSLKELSSFSTFLWFLWWEMMVFILLLVL